MTVIFRHLLCRPPGTIIQDSTMVQVELRPFNDRMLNRDKEKELNGNFA